MALMEDELHKLHLRLVAFEGDVKDIPEHLKPSSKIFEHSTVVEPEKTTVVEPVEVEKPVEPVVEPVAEPVAEPEHVVEPEEAK